MNLNKTILTERNTTDLSWYQVAFEWEDVYADILGLSIQPMSKALREGHLHTLLREAISLLTPFRAAANQWNLAQVMYPRLSHRYRNSSVIPIYLDIPARWIRKIHWETRHLPIYFVTSLDAYRALTQLAAGERCQYLPLSIPDRYYTSVCSVKDIDVIQMGRKNSILHRYMLEFCKTHPQVNYVYRDGIKYISTRYPAKTYLASTRAEYMNLLKRARISLVATPAIDGDKDFGGFDFFTPRFFESIVCYCHVIGRYPRNEEAEFFKMAPICPRIEHYREFEQIVMEKLETPNEINTIKYQQFIQDNLTSTRAKTLKQQLTKAGLIV